MLINHECQPQTLRNSFEWGGLGSRNIFCCCVGNFINSSEYIRNDTRSCTPLSRKKQLVDVLQSGNVVHLKYLVSVIQWPVKHARAMWTVPQALRYLKYVMPKGTAQNM